MFHVHIKQNILFWRLRIWLKTSVIYFKQKLLGMFKRDGQIRVSILCRDAQAIYLEHANADIFRLREIAIEAILDLVEDFQSNDEVLVHAIALFDQLIAKNILKHSDRANIVKFAVGCFMIASKLKDTNQPFRPRIWELASFASCRCDEIRSVEEAVVVALDWNIDVTTGILFISALHCVCISIF